MDAQAVAAWFLTERGITTDTLRAFGVRMDHDRGNLVFPYPNGEKERPDVTKPRDEGRKRFYFTRGQVPELFVAPDNGQSEAAFLVEGETDTMSTWQNLRAAGQTADVYGLAGVNTWRSLLADKYLKKYKRVYVVLDNDDYNAASTIEQVNQVWREIRRDVPNAKRIYLPPDVKDPCEFWQRDYDVAYLQRLCQRMGFSQYELVDFSKDPPPVVWAIENLIAAGDVTILGAKGGVGKSWLTMGAALAVLNGSPTFLNQPVSMHGNVLYVDEENPIDVIHSRLKRMGLTPGPNLRYIWNQGVRLDRHFDRFIDEAMDFKPKLICMDSLTRLHSKAENDSGEMAALFNDALRPLARETGAAVVLIHHHSHAGGLRGSTDIFNGADAIIDAKPYGANGVQLVQSKTRRRGRVDNLTYAIEDQPDGTVKLVANPPFVPPF